MNVLLIGPSTKEAITDTRWVTAPLGVHYIASFLNQHGHNAVIYDCNIDTLPLEYVLTFGWDVIGFSVLEATLEYDLSNIHLAKKRSPASILVAGGTGATLNYQEIFNKSPLDIVIQAEGEYPMLSLCNMIDEYGYKKSPLHLIPGIIFRSYASKITQEDYWNIRKCLDIKKTLADKYWDKTASLYDSPDYNEINTFRLSTSNYCPMNCAFCTLTRLRKYACGDNYKVIALSSTQVIKLVMQVLEEYPECKQIFFVDDDFFIIKQRGIDFCTGIIDLKEASVIPKDLRFLCLTNINRIDNDNIDLIKKAGFRVLSIGVESTSQYVLDSLDKKQTVDKIWEVTELILSKGVKPYYTLILFAPESRVEDLMTDLAGFRKLGKMGVGLSVEPYFIPLKGTRFSEEQYPERVRTVPIEGTRETITKGFAWLPKDPETQEVFKVFEEIYPRYRKFVFDNTAVKHKEKNFQAYIILDSLEYSLLVRGYVDPEDITDNPIFNNIKKILAVEKVNVDIVGSLT